VVNGVFYTRGRSAAPGGSFKVSSIIVLGIHDGPIVALRDYYDHLALAGAAGRRAQLVAALTDG